jgi:hypothetical protein
VTEDKGFQRGFHGHERAGTGLVDTKVVTKTYYLPTGMSFITVSVSSSISIQ